MNKVKSKFLKSMNIGRKMVELIMIAANLLVVVLMLLAIVAANISPVKFIWPAYTTLALPFIIAANTGFIIFWILFRKWYLLLSLITLICSYSIVKNTFVINFDQQSENILHGDSVFSLMTYNTHANDMMASHTASKPNKLIQYVLDKYPDILCIQEYSAAKLPGNLSKKDLSIAFSKYPYRYVYFKHFTGWSYFGIAVFSKFPIVARKPVEMFSNNSNCAVYTDLIINGKRVRVFNCHLESNQLTEDDKIMAIRLKDNLQTENIKGTTMHLSKKLGVAYRVRANQADRIADEIKRTPYPVIVAGDFNDIPSSYTYSRIRGGFNDAFEEKGFGFGWTFTESVIRFRIDHVLYDNHFEAESVKIDHHFKVSDHYPVLTHLIFKNN